MSLILAAVVTKFLPPLIVSVRNVLHLWCNVSTNVLYVCFVHTQFRGHMKLFQNIRLSEKLTSEYCMYKSP